jgi:NADH dehydrogenase FAD-containing subunit
MSHHVVVLGAGYAGLPAAKRLARQLFADEVTVTLVTASAHFVERPRLHQLATGQDIVATPLTHYLDGTGIRLVVGTAEDIDLAARTVRVARDGAAEVLGYDTLVYALGSNIDRTRVPGVAAHAHTLTGRDAAARFGERLAPAAEQGGSVVVCGGGLTGIETAAEVAESYPALDVQLVTAGTPGGWLSGRAQRYLRKVFTELGVSVREGQVEEVADGRLVLADGGRVRFDVCGWAGGFLVPGLARGSGLAVTDTGRAVVDRTLRSVSHPDVYVIGDAAAVPGKWGDELAMGCRTGSLTGPKVADVIAARLTGRQPGPFRYRYFHECISLGRRHGVVQFLAADETPKERVLTGRAAIAYKNATLNGARLMFRWPGPYRPGARRARAAG